MDNEDIDTYFNFDIVLNKIDCISDKIDKYLSDMDLVLNEYYNINKNNKLSYDGE